MEEYPSVLDTPEYKLTKIAIHAARAYYDKETFDHAKRVADYTSDNEAIPFDIRNECWCVALMHDLLEDTDYEPYELYPDYECAYKALRLLTNKGKKYEDYCECIHNSTRTRYGQIAWFVKLADIKDHLILSDTLTDRLKEKYLRGLRRLL